MGGVDCPECEEISRVTKAIAECIQMEPSRVASLFVEALREAYQAGSDGARLRLDVLSWLGFWRDKLPPEAVSKLQDIVSPVSDGQ